MGHARSRPGPIRSPACPCDGFPGPGVRCGPSEQSYSDLRPGRKFPDGVETVWPPERACHRPERHAVCHRYTDDQRPHRFENGIYIGSAKDGKVAGFIPKIRPHSTWEGTGPDRTNMEAIGVAPDASAIYGGETGML